MNLLEKARELVRNSTLPAELVAYAEDGYYWNGQNSLNLEEALTPEILATSLCYQIDAKTKAVSDEHAVPIGTSKYKGLPHLPRGTEWPEGLYFCAQFNLADLAGVDRMKRLPETGMLYLFVNAAGEEAVIYWDGDMSELEVRAYPDAETLDGAEYYLEDFIGDSALIEFEPYWLFYLNEGDSYDYRDIRSTLPDELVQQISDLLGCSLGTWDGSCRLYGRPHYWQGEDEGWLGEPDDFDEEGNPIWSDEEEEPELLLFEDEFGEGNIHFWVEFKDAAEGDFDSAWVGYSGT